MSAPSQELNGPNPKPQSLDVNSTRPAEPQPETYVDGGLASLLAELRQRGVAPTNYLRVSKTDTSIEGKYAIDLTVPPLLRSAADGVLISHHNHNLLLQTSKGHIDAEVWVIHDESGKSKRASLTFLNQSGSVRAKVHSSDGKSAMRPNLDIEVCANSGDVAISLPRAFRGEIIIRASSDRITFSPALGACTSPLLDIPEERVYFVRDELVEGRKRRRNGSSDKGQGQAQSQQEEESQDALLVSGDYRSVRINWSDEDDLPWLRLLGMKVVAHKLGPGWKAFWNDVGKLVLPSRDF